jgi:hypothetical protein
VIQLLLAGLLMRCAVASIGTDTTLPHGQKAIVATFLFGRAHFQIRQTRTSMLDSMVVNITCRSRLSIIALTEEQTR